MPYQGYRPAKRDKSHTQPAKGYKGQQYGPGEQYTKPPEPIERVGRQVSRYTGPPARPTYEGGYPGAPRYGENTYITNWFSRNRGNAGYPGVPSGDYVALAKAIGSGVANVARGVGRYWVGKYQGYRQGLNSRLGPGGETLRRGQLEAQHAARQLAYNLNQAVTKFPAAPPSYTQHPGYQREMETKAQYTGPTAADQGSKGASKVAGAQSEYWTYPGYNVPLIPGTNLYGPQGPVLPESQGVLESPPTGAEGTGGTDYYDPGWYDYGDYSGYSGGGGGGGFYSSPNFFNRYRPGYAAQSMQAQPAKGLRGVQLEPNRNYATQNQNARWIHNLVSWSW